MCFTCPFLCLLVRCAWWDTPLFLFPYLTANETSLLTQTSPFPISLPLFLLSFPFQQGTFTSSALAQRAEEENNLVSQKRYITAPELEKVCFFFFISYFFFLFLSFSFPFFPFLSPLISSLPSPPLFIRSKRKTAYTPFFLSHIQALVVPNRTSLATSELLVLCDSALSLYDDPGEEPRHEDILFRALLRVLLERSLVSLSFSGWVSPLFLSPSPPFLPFPLNFRHPHITSTPTHTLLSPYPLLSPLFSVLTPPLNSVLQELVSFSPLARLATFAASPSTWSSTKRCKCVCLNFLVIIVSVLIPNRTSRTSRTLTMIHRATMCPDNCTTTFATGPSRSSLTQKSLNHGSNRSRVR